MPLFRYFVFVGGTLLALLFISDAVLPGQSLPGYMNASSSELPAFRIRSDQKWPERIVFDTSVPSIKPAVVAEVVPATPVNVPAIAPQTTDVRDAFAQLSSVARNSGVKTEASVKQAASKAQEVRAAAKRKVAKARPARPIMLVAQQPHFGLFDSTW
jgi:hypothetical protein